MKERNVRCSAEEWRRLVEEHKVSGLAVAEYCRVKKLSAGSFYKWQKRFRGEGSRKGFVQVGVPVLTRRGSVVIETPAGYRIEVADGTGREFLQEVIQSLEVR